MKEFLFYITLIYTAYAIECDVGTFLSDGVCTNHSMTNETECVGGVFRYGTNTTDSRCLECVGSYLVEHEDCDICTASCIPHSMTNQTNCTGGLYVQGTNVSDSTCIHCPNGTFEKYNNNTCYNWTYHSQDDCIKFGNRGVYHPGNNQNDSYCVPCVTESGGKGYYFEVGCRDCLDLKSHFDSLHCCRDQFKKPQIGKRTPFRDECQYLIDAWKIDCDQYCFIS